MMEGRAPGKVLLLGEHAVVYGHPALAAAISRSVVVRIERASETRFELPGGIALPFAVVEAAERLAREAGFGEPFHAAVQSEIPLGSGLGSSAARGVALARAFRPRCAAEEAARLTMHIESVLHGAPSGVDPAVCALGGIIEFVRGAAPRVEAVRGSAHIVVALSGIARGTRTTVMPLAERRKSDRTIDAKLAGLGELSRKGRTALEAGALGELGSLFDAAHGMLRELGVSCPELDALVEKLKAAGALGAKLTGAGGGGAAIALARDAEHAARIAAQVGGFVERLG